MSYSSKLVICSLWMYPVYDCVISHSQSSMTQLKVHKNKSFLDITQTTEPYIQNSVKHWRWNFLRKLIAAGNYWNYFPKTSTLDVWQTSEYGSAQCIRNLVKSCRNIWPITIKQSKTAQTWFFGQRHPRVVETR